VKTLHSVQSLQLAVAVAVQTIPLKVLMVVQAVVREQAVMRAQAQEAKDSMVELQMVTLQVLVVAQRQSVAIRPKEQALVLAALVFILFLQTSLA
jgi:hypothetical protein